MTATDLAELQRMLAESGVGAAEDIKRAAEESQGLGIFVRSLVGLTHAARDYQCRLAGCAEQRTAASAGRKRRPSERLPRHQALQLMDTCPY